MWILCLKSQQLGQHCVHIVNDYADIMSMTSMTLLTPCSRSQRLCWQCVHIVSDYVNKCLHCQRLHRHCVGVINKLYTGKQFLNRIQISVTFIISFLFFKSKTRSWWLSIQCGHRFLVNMFAKTKMLQNHFSLFIWDLDKVENLVARSFK